MQTDNIRGLLCIKIIDRSLNTLVRGIVWGEEEVDEMNVGSVLDSLIIMKE